LNLPFGDYLRQPRKDQGAPGEPEVGMRAKLEHPLGDDPPSERWRRLGGDFAGRRIIRCSPEIWA
jgi:hypothetical protein